MSDPSVQTCHLNVVYKTSPKPYPVTSPLQKKGEGTYTVWDMMANTCCCHVVFEVRQVVRPSQVTISPCTIRQADTARVSSPVLGHGWPGLLGSCATVKKALPLSPLASDSENRLVVSSPAEVWSQKRGRGTLSENYLSCSKQLAMLKDTRRMLGADFPSTAILPQALLDTP